MYEAVVYGTESLKNHQQYEKYINLAQEMNLLSNFIQKTEINRC